MFEMIFHFLKEMGAAGLFMGTALEASSVPFPGALVILIYGFLLKPNLLETLLLALAVSAVYTIFSYVPYVIGYKLESKMKEKFSEKKVEKTKRGFKKYGEWSIALSRPLGIGNYVSYAAGMSKVNRWKFGGLTFIGIFPLAVAMLFLGRLGEVKTVNHVLQASQNYILAGAGVLLVCCLLYKFVYKKRTAS
ncbi:DedA family protein [Fictibacillus terranigra]|uniref:VTT domain-containing protein n=1 Tax=Fictibacillus terranigra TaxID=3058424 RepID=A0ABT8E9S8_9BACL|nr:VTT domain-containing protein [Fictibacillus sp. CENA-BCM004]MDN4074652.1 VTT domain-containing protein [Fictibacillus sp. CENA-BCM004]